MSNAPMSYADHCGRGVPMISLVTLASDMPRSLAGLPERNWKSRVEAFTNCGSLQRLCDSVVPAPAELR